ncbi:MAG: YhbY family RNA-binding protein [Treponemataceae bacterium]|nr:YhbY family RNA-binding protein [Treponemataceae bacterium]
MIELTSKQRKVLEKYAQPLSPLVQVGGAGLTDEQIKNIDRIIGSHELIKIKYNNIKALSGTESKDELKQGRMDLDREIESKTNSTHVRTIGNVAIFYRAAEKAEDRKYEKALSKA